MRDVAEAMHAHAFVDVQRARADQAGQLAGRLAALQIHLEEPILRVEEAERAGHVFARRAGDGRHAERVAIDADRSTSSPAIAAVPSTCGKAGAQLRARIDAAGHDQHACQRRPAGIRRIAGRAEYICDICIWNS